MNVSQSIQFCDTGLIKELSDQIIRALILENPGVLARVDHELVIVEGPQNNPYLQTAAYHALIAAVESRGEQLHINSCLRTPMQQHIIRRQFELGICCISAAARPPRSKHNSGLAIDVAGFCAWEPFLARQKWRWCGNLDPWHFDFIGGGVDLGGMQVKIFQQLWNKANPNDRIDPDGIWGPATAAKVDSSPAGGFTWA